MLPFERYKDYNFRLKHTKKIWGYQLTFTLWMMNPTSNQTLRIGISSASGDPVNDKD